MSKYCKLVRRKFDVNQMKIKIICSAFVVREDQFSKNADISKKASPIERNIPFIASIGKPKKLHLFIKSIANIFHLPRQMDQYKISAI